MPLLQPQFSLPTGCLSCLFLFSFNLIVTLTLFLFKINSSNLLPFPKGTIWQSYFPKALIQFLLKIEASSLTSKDPIWLVQRQRSPP